MGLLDTPGEGLSTTLNYFNIHVVVLTGMPYGFPTGVEMARQKILNSGY
jgi:hypothetical protein